MNSTSIIITPISRASLGIPYMNKINNIMPIITVYGYNGVLNVPDFFILLECITAKLDTRYESKSPKLLIAAIIYTFPEKSITIPIIEEIITPLTDTSFFELNFLKSFGRSLFSPIW